MAVVLMLMNSSEKFVLRQQLSLAANGGNFALFHDCDLPGLGQWV
jgi:hypothetical protein